MPFSSRPRNAGRADWPAPERHDRSTASRTQAHSLAGAPGRHLERAVPCRGRRVRPSYPSYRDSGISWLGELPAHWRTLTLSRIGSFLKGGGGTKEDETDEGYACVRYGDLYTRHDFHVRESRSRIAPERASVYTDMQYGDLLLAGSGETLEEIGKSAVNLLREPAFCGGDVIILRPEIDIDAAYLGYAADCAPSRHQKSCMGRGVTVMHIYGRELKNLIIPMPPLEEQRQIGAFLDQATDRIDELVQRTGFRDRGGQIAGTIGVLIERLLEYRSALITAAVTGKIDVRGADSVGAAATDASSVGSEVAT